MSNYISTTIFNDFIKLLNQLTQQYALMIQNQQNLIDQEFNLFDGQYETLVYQKNVSSNYINEYSNQSLRKIKSMAENIEEKKSAFLDINKSFKKRYNNSFILPSNTSMNMDGLNDDIENTKTEVEILLNECIRENRIYPFQEIALFFSKKLRKKYQQLDQLFQTADSISTKGDQLVPSERNELILDIENNFNIEVSELEEGTVSTLEFIYQECSTKIDEFLVDMYLLIENHQILKEIVLTNQTLNELNQSNSDEQIENFDILHLGNYQSFINSDEYPSDLLLVLDTLFGSTISNHVFGFPAIFNRNEQMNFIFHSANEHDAKQTIQSIIGKLLFNTPASLQELILISPINGSNDFDIYLDLLFKHNKIHNQIISQKNSIKEQLEILRAHIDTMNQSTLIGFNSLYEYNQNNVDIPQPYKTLCIMDFPNQFDEGMLDDLHHIMRNGAKCGVNVILDIQQDYLIDEYHEGIFENIFLEGHNYYSDNQRWYCTSDIELNFLPIPTQLEIGRFDQSYQAQIERLNKRYVEIDKINPINNWYKSSTEQNISIPIGINQNGVIHNIQFGQNIGSGTSHHGLIIGPTGSGKSTLLHTIILNAITKYSPDEINLYLLDFKEGLEFNIYSSYKIPHIKVLAIDAMQDFGKSVLFELYEVLKTRTELFAKENVNNIVEYRQKTGKKLPRILTIMDEFQVLYNHETNRKVARACGIKTAELISLGRAYGIHLLFATQTLSRIGSGDFSINWANLNEMHVRIGLKCIESESTRLFGDDLGRSAYKKMTSSIDGKAVYSENLNGEILTELRVAFSNAEKKEQILSIINELYQDKSDDKKVFFSKQEFSIFDNEEFSSLQEGDSKIILGEKIMIAPPLKVNPIFGRKNNLLIVGNDENNSMNDKIVSSYLLNIFKTTPVNSKNIFFIDGNNHDELLLNNSVKDILHSMPDKVSYAENGVDVLQMIDEVYDIFQNRRKGLDQERENIYFFLHNLQWNDSLQSVFENEPIDVLFTENIQSSDTSAFDYLNTDALSAEDELEGLIHDSIFSSSTNDNESTYQQKLYKLIKRGYANGINIVLTADTFSTIQEFWYDIKGYFLHRIIFSINETEGQRLIEDASTKELRDGIALYSNGVDVYQFKPFTIN